MIRFRLDADDDGDGRSGDDAEDEHETMRGWFLNPTDLGGVFVRASVAFTALTVLSIVALVVVLLGAAEEPFVDQPTIETPLSAWLWLLSHTGAAISMLGYSAWSFRKQRRLKARTTDHGDVGLLEKPIWFFRIASKDDDEVSEYEARVQKTVFSFVLGVFVANMPARIWLNPLL